MTSSSPAQQSLLGLEAAPPFERFQDLGVDPGLGVPARLIDIPETIPQLGYATHQHFRYYGKFPSLLGREIVAARAVRGLPVLDCYAGSGTTLVEAQIAGFESAGVDINPVAVAACNVKTGYYEAAAIHERMREVVAMARSRAAAPVCSLSASKQEKWFTAEALDELARLKQALLTLPDDHDRRFLEVAFLAIVRRVSRAYDGEVRPHVNPTKPPKSPLAFFERKVADMLIGLDELDRMRPGGVASIARVADNRNAAALDGLASAPAGLVVAHPPYLNSFNYLQVFSLELGWSLGFDSIWAGWSEREIKAAEHKAWPATNATLVERYYADFAAVLGAIAPATAPEATVAVVIGDATIRGELEPVHQKCMALMDGAGFQPSEVWFRTTHYGIGKYAYRDRADYHGAAEKRDAVLFGVKRS